MRKAGGLSAARRTPMPTGRRQKLGEHYNTLVQHIQVAEAGPGPSLQVIGVTSCNRGAGVSTVANNLAVAAAQILAGRVVLVDANLKRPSVRKRFRMPKSSGLSDALHGDSELTTCIQNSPVGNLCVVPAGAANALTEEYCDPTAMSELVDALKKEAAFIVFDLPAAVELSTCFAMVGSLDGVLLVVEAERTDSRAAVRARKQLVEAHANMLGIVFNKRREYIPGWLYRLF